jgi:hypothetical protein
MRQHPITRTSAVTLERITEDFSDILSDRFFIDVPEGWYNTLYYAMHLIAMKLSEIESQYDEEVVFLIHSIQCGDSAVDIDYTMFIVEKDSSKITSADFDDYISGVWGMLNMVLLETCSFCGSKGNDVVINQTLKSAPLVYCKSCERKALRETYNP